MRQIQSKDLFLIWSSPKILDKFFYIRKVLKNQDSGQNSIAPKEALHQQTNNHRR